MEDFLAIAYIQKYDEHLKSKNYAVVSSDVENDYELLHQRLMDKFGTKTISQSEEIILASLIVFKYHRDSISISKELTDKALRMLSELEIL